MRNHHTTTTYTRNLTLDTVRYAIRRNEYIVLLVLKCVYRINDIEQYAEQFECGSIPKYSNILKHNSVQIVLLCFNVFSGHSYPKLENTWLYLVSSFFPFLLFLLLLLLLWMWMWSSKMLPSAQQMWHPTFSVHICFRHASVCSN